jgi:hypothetical protein
VSGAVLSTRHQLLSNRHQHGEPRRGVASVRTRAYAAQGQAVCFDKSVGAFQCLAVFGEPGLGPLASYCAGHRG